MPVPQYKCARPAVLFVISIEYAFSTCAGARRRACLLNQLQLQLAYISSWVQRLCVPW